MNTDCGDRYPELGGCVIDRRKLAGEVRRLSAISNTTHYRLFSSRVLNEWISDLFCAFPVGLSTMLYRRQHLDHHRYVNTEKDPYWTQMQAQEDWDWPKTHIESARLFAKDIVGLNLLKMLALFGNWSPAPRVLRTYRGTNTLNAVEQARWVGFIAVAGLALQLTHGWIPFLCLWLVPSLTVLGAFARLRSAAEHLVLEGTNELNSSRHVEASLIESWTISPLNINYHIAHHLFPSVPQYNLRELQRVLMRDETFAREAHIVRGYLNPRRGVVSELLRRDDAAATQPAG